MPEREHFTNFRCLVFGTGFALMGAAFGAQVSGWNHWVSIGIGYGIGIALMIVATVLITQSVLSKKASSSAPQSPGAMPGIPTLSGLLGQNPTVEFNSKQHFALAYYSPVTAEVEKNIKIVAQRDFPNDKEAFYARFIGIGIVVYQCDITWFLIFGCQIQALVELNSHGRTVPISDLLKHYDKAVKDYPATYTKYPFEEWLDFMKSRFLITVYPSQMVEISWGGKDFLKYLAHAGRDINGKKN